MITKTEVLQKVTQVNAILLILAFIAPCTALGKIPEPDNIIYGVAREDAAIITLEVNGEQIASYTMGENPNAGVYYILRVPMDALAPAEPGKAHTGDEGFIYINDDIAPIASITIGERGAIHQLDLGTTDNDTDGMPDQWEQQIVDALPNDGIDHTWQVEGADDFDNDGYSNYREYLAGSHPVDTLVIPYCFADMDTDGDVDGDDLSRFIADYPFGTCECPSDTDGDGDIDEWDFRFVTEDYGRNGCW